MTINVLLSNGYRNGVTLLSVNLLLDVANELCCCAFALNFCGEVIILAVLPGLRNVNLNVCSSTCINSVMVHLNDVVTLLRIRLGSCVLHELDNLLFRNQLGQREECRLKNGIDTVTKTDFLTNLNTIDDVELNVVLSDVSLNLSRKLLIQLILSPLSIEEECSARNKILNHVVLVDVCSTVASYEVCLAD